MKELANKKITLIIILVVTILLLYYLFNFWSDGLYAKFNSNVGLELFYSFQDFVPNFLILGLLSTCLVAESFYQNKQSRFQNCIIARVGYKERVKYEVKNIVITSFIIRLLFNIFVLLIIHMFFSNVTFKEYSDASYYASGVVELFTNSKLSLLFYIIYSSIGFSIFSLFIYSISYFIKNQHVFKISGIVLFIGLTVLSAIIGNQLYIYFSDIKFANPILQALTTSSLMVPAMMGFTSITSLFETHIYFWYTCLCFIIYSAIFLYIRYKMERKNG